MRFPRPLVIVALIAAFAAPVSSAASGLTASERAAKMDVIRTDIRALLPAFQEQLARGKNFSVRTITNAALAALVVNGDVAQAQWFLRKALSVQVTDPNAPDYGNLPWDFSPSSPVRDDNSMAFSAEPLGPLLELYGDKLDGSFRKFLVSRTPGMFAELERHHVKISYTNIYIMQATDLIVLGEAVHDQNTASLGYDQFSKWLDYTSKAGIGEYDSPTYYGVDMDVLYLGYRFCRRPGCQAMYARALDYFWRDVEANLFRHELLSGPHSRDYDFLRGDGMVYQYLAMEEPQIPMSAHAIDPNSFARAYVIIACGADGYHPSPAILALADGSRVVQQRFSPDVPPRYNYVTDDFAIGNVSADSGPQDKVVSVDLAPVDLPNITIFFDRHDSPYGLHDFNDGAGHYKPDHLPLNPLGVQDRGTLLELFDPDPAKAAASPTLATDVVLPRDATIVTAGGPVKVTPDLDLHLQATDAIGVRSGEGAVIVRPLAIDPLGAPAQFELKADADGYAKGAIRLAIYNYRGAAAKLPYDHLRMAFLIVAAHVSNDDDLMTLLGNVSKAPFTSAVEDGVWRVQVSYGGHTLAGARDATTRAIVTDTVDGRSEPDPLFAVNGVAYPF